MSIENAITVTVDMSELVYMIHFMRENAFEVADACLMYASDYTAKVLKKIAPVSKYPRIYDRYYSRGRLRRSIESRKMGGFYAILGVGYGILVSRGFRGWSRSRSKPYVFESTRHVRKKGSTVNRNTVITYKVNKAGRIKRTNFIPTGIERALPHVRRIISNIIHSYIEGKL